MLLLEYLNKPYTYTIDWVVYVHKKNSILMYKKNLSKEIIESEKVVNDINTIEWKEKKIKPNLSEEQIAKLREEFNS